jgi:tRNA G26 N,N-dimethylase Trm1
MSWRQSSGRDRCNDCRVTVPEGAALYVGELTPAKWCEACAGKNLQKHLGDSEDVPKHLPVATGLTGMRELLAKFAPKVRRSWEERE